MFNRILLLRVALACAFLGVISVGTTVRAEQLAQNLGPVGPYDPILTAVGTTRVIAFFEPSNNNCGIHAVIWDNRNDDVSATRVRATLRPGQIVNIDTAPNESLDLQCGDNGATLKVLSPDELIATGATIREFGIGAGAGGR